MTRVSHRVVLVARVPARRRRDVCFGGGWNERVARATARPRERAVAGAFGGGRDGRRSRTPIPGFRDSHAHQPPAAALESTCAGRGGERWPESVRGDARGAVAPLPASVVARAARRRAEPRFGVRELALPRPSVCLWRHRDIGPSMSHLFSGHRARRTRSTSRWFWRRAARVVSYSDFRALHAAAEREVSPAVGLALALPAAAPGTIPCPATPRCAGAARASAAIPGRARVERVPGGGGAARGVFESRRRRRRRARRVS